MKVLHVIASIDESTGGPARSVPKSCIELAKIGVEIEIITQKSENPVPIPETENLTITYKTLSELIKYAANLSTHSVDLIHLQHIWTPYVNIMAFCAQFKNIPYLITPRGMLEPWIMARNPWKKKMAMLLYQNKVIQRANYIHVTAQMEADHIYRLGYSNPITIIPNGIDLNEITTSKTKYGTKKMVFLSRIHPKKGIELLLAAWQSINTEGWSLEIAGNGNQTYITKLKQSASDLKNVFFVGPQYGEAKWNFIRSADVMLLPSFSENFGIVIAEALAVGVPVLTTKGTPWEDLEIYDCGWWIDLSEINLRKGLIDAMKTPTKTLKKMGQEGKKLIKEKYQIKATAKNILKLYKRLLKL